MIKLKAALKALNIQAGEEKRVGLLLLHSFFVGLTLVFLATAASTLFLSKFNVEQLPYAYIGSAIVITLLGLGYSQLESRLSTPKTLSITLSVLLLSLLAFYLSLQFSEALGLILALLIWNEVVIVFSSIEFWGLTGRLFDVRQGKRLFGLIGTGEIIASITGGFSIPFIVKIIAPRHLILVSVLGLFLSLMVLAVIIRTQGDYLSEEEEEEEEDNSSLLDLIKNPYLILIFSLSAISVLGFYFVDYMFYQQVEANYPTESELAGFIGTFFAISGTLQLLIRIFLSGRLLSRYGQAFGLLVLPLSLLGTMLILTLNGFSLQLSALLFWIIICSKLLDTVVRPAFEEPSVLILYQPLPPDKRLSSQAVVESIFEPLASGVAGGIIILLTVFFQADLLTFALVMLPILGGWLTISLTLRYRYTRELIRSLKKRTLSDGSLSLEDASSLSILNDTLKSADPEDAIHALELLEYHQSDNIIAFIRQALSHQHSTVKREALIRVERLKLEELTPDIYAYFEREEDPLLKGLAIRVYCLLSQEQGLELTSPYLNHPNTEVQMNAMIGLLRNGGIEGVLIAGEYLLKFRESLVPAERILAARILGEVGIRNFYQPLERLLMDINRDVRLEAIKASRKVPHPKLWRLLADNLASPATRLKAAEALQAAGEAVVPTLIDFFKEQRGSLEIQQRIIKIAAKIKGPSAQEQLLTILDFPQQKIQYLALKALVSCEYKVSSKASNEIFQRFQNEVREMTWLMSAEQNLNRSEPRSELLENALQELLILKRKKLFLYLCFSRNTRAIQRAEFHALAKHSSKQAYALETLDNLLTLEEKQYLLPLVENLNPASHLKTYEQWFPQPSKTIPEHLKELLSHSQYIWLQACVLYTIGKETLTELSELIVEYLNSPYALLRETALWSAYQLKIKDRLNYCKTSLADPSTQVTHLARTLLNSTNKQGVNMRLTIEKVLILKSISIFSQIPDEALSEVAAMAKEIEVAKGETIIEEGEMGQTMYILIEGQMEITSKGQVLASIRKREVFGELAALDPEPRLASVMASEDSVLFQFDDRTLYELMADYPEVGRGIITVLCRRLREQSRKTHELIAQT